MGSCGQQRWQRARAFAAGVVVLAFQLMVCAPTSAVPLGIPGKGEVEAPATSLPIPEPTCRSGGAIPPIDCDPGMFCIFITPGDPKNDVAALGVCINEAELPSTCVQGGAVPPIECPPGFKCQLALAGGRGTASIGFCEGPPSELVTIGGVCGHGGRSVPPLPTLTCASGLECNYNERCNPEVADTPCYGVCVSLDSPPAEGPVPMNEPSPGPDPFSEPGLGSQDGGDSGPSPSPRSLPEPSEGIRTCTVGGSALLCEDGWTCVVTQRGPRGVASQGVCIPNQVVSNMCVSGGNVMEVECSEGYQCLPLVPGADNDTATVGICQIFRMAPSKLGGPCVISTKSSGQRCARGLKCDVEDSCNPDEGCQGKCIRLPMAYVPLGQVCSRPVNVSRSNPSSLCAPGLKCAYNKTCADEGPCEGLCVAANEACREGGSIMPVPCDAETTCVFVSTMQGDTAAVGVCIPNSQLPQACVFGGEVPDMPCQDGYDCTVTIPGGPDQASIGMCLKKKP